MEHRTDAVPEAATLCSASSPHPTERPAESFPGGPVASESNPSPSCPPSGDIRWEIQAVFFPPCSIVPIFLRIALFTTVFSVLLAVGAAVSLGRMLGLTSLLRFSGMGLTVLSALGFVICILVFRRPLSVRYILDERGLRLFLLSHGSLGTRLLTTLAGWFAGFHRREGTKESPSPFSWAGRGPFWKDVRGVRLHPDEKLILLHLPFLGFLPVHCNPEDYGTIARAVEERVGYTLSKAPVEDPAPLRVFSVTRRLWHTFLAVFAFLLLRTFPLEVPNFMPRMILAAALVTLWIRPVRRMAAGFLLATSLSCAAFIFLDGLKTRKLFNDSVFRNLIESANFALCSRSSAWVLETYTHFGDMTPGEWFAAAVAVSGLCYFLWLGLTRVRHSGCRQERKD